jgi:hypothetical protein
MLINGKPAHTLDTILKLLVMPIAVAILIIIIILVNLIPGGEEDEGNH